MSKPLLILRLVGIAVAAFVIAVTAVALWSGPDPAPGGAGRKEEARQVIGGPFTLTDAAGKRRTEADFRGKHMLVFFGFTNCPDFCPTALYTVTQAMEKLGAKADGLAPIFISVDPERDTVQQLANYAQNFDKRFVMLTGTAAEIEAAARAYRVYYAKRPLEKAGEYTMDHSAYMYLMGPDGKFITHFRHAVSPADLAAALDKRL